MKEHVKILSLTLLAVVVLDLAVMIVLTFSDGRISALQPVVAYFEYGRSVPGKLNRWIERPNTAGNLFDVAWRSELIENSRLEFMLENEETPPVVRAYGMSFVNNILREAKNIQPNLLLDLHSGPGAPPNFTYAAFLDDRKNRRAGDIVVLGILSSSVPALAAMSNRTWVFEQPAPFTYPIFLPTDNGLNRIDPLINSAEAELKLADDPEGAKEWNTYIREYDAYYSFVSFGWPILDKSPFLRLLRRSLAVSGIERQKAKLIGSAKNTEFPYERILQMMVVSFAEAAREDNQYPIVFLIQSQDTNTPDLLDITKSILIENDIPYIATAEYADVRDPSIFREEGHYKRYIDKIFGAAFLAAWHSNERSPK